MFGLPNPWKYATIGSGIALVLLLGWALRLNSLRGSWEQKYSDLDGQAQTVLLATRQATNNPTLKWPDVSAQITALASSNLALKGSIADSNTKIETMATETARLKVAGDQLRAQFAEAQRQRATVDQKLAAMASTPGDHENCPALLSQAQDALNLAYGSGL